MAIICTLITQPSGQTKANTSPTYKGGSDPIAKYALTSGSAGHAAGSDGKDMGADISNVGSGASQQTTNTTPPATPTGVTVQIIN